MTNKLNRNDWGTPQDLFNVLDAEFHFTIDVAANAENTKCERYWDNALIASFKGERVFCNPPFGAKGVNGAEGIRAWLLWAWTEVKLAADPNTMAVVFTPSDPSNKWFQYFTPCAWQVRLCAHPRVRFVPPKGVKESSPRSSIAIFIFVNWKEPPGHQKLILWDWQKAVADLAAKKGGA